MAAKPFFVIPAPLGTVSSGNERANRPASHLGEFAFRGMVWQSSGPSNLWVRCDLGEAQAIDFVGLLSASAIPGATTIRARLGDSQAEVDGTADYDSGALAFVSPSITRDDGLYHSHLELPSLMTKRWLRIDLGNHSGDFQAGVLVAGRKISPAQYYEPVWDRGLRDLGGVTFARNGVPGRSRGPKLPTMSFKLAWLNEAEMESTFTPLDEVIGKSEPVYLCFDPEATVYRQRRTFLGFMEENPVFTKRGYDRFERSFSLLSILGGNLAESGPVHSYAIPPALPESISAPVVSGTARQGQTLSTTNGVWSNSPTGYSRQWLRNGSAISGETGATYLLTAADIGANITVVVIASNGAGPSAPATSNSIGPVLPLVPVNTVLPAITGTAEQGQTLSCSTGTWSNSPTGYAYQWRRGGSNISGATNATYVLQAADVGSTMTCAVIASNAGGPSAAPAISNSLGPVNVAGAGGEPSTVTLIRTSAAGTNPPVYAVALGIDAIAGDTITLRRSQSETFASGNTDIVHVVTNAEAAARTAAGFTIPTLSTGAPWYFTARKNAEPWSNTVKWNEATAPTITTNAAQSVQESSVLAVALTADEAIARWDIVGGDDQHFLEISGTTLRWNGNGTANFDRPLDVGNNNTYQVIVQATDLAGNTSTKTITVTVTAADKVCDAFTFTDVSTAVPGNVYTSNVITIAGLTSGVSVATTISGMEYRKNGGAWTPAGSTTAANGDTFQLRATAITGIVSGTLTVGTVSDTYSLSDGSTPSATRWRINVAATEAGGAVSFVELEMRATAGGADQCSGGTVSASTPGYSGFEADKLFDDNNATGYFSDSGSLPVWVEYTFASAVRVAQVAIRAWNDPGARFTPKTFSIQYHNGSGWADLWGVTNEPNWSHGEQRTYTKP